MTGIPQTWITATPLLPLTAKRKISRSVVYIFSNAKVSRPGTTPGFNIIGAGIDKVGKIEPVSRLKGPISAKLLPRVALVNHLARFRVKNRESVDMLG